MLESSEVQKYQCFDCKFLWCCDFNMNWNAGRHSFWTMKYVNYVNSYCTALVYCLCSCVRQYILYKPVYVPWTYHVWVLFLLMVLIARQSLPPVTPLSQMEPCAPCIMDEKEEGGGEGKSGTQRRNGSVCVCVLKWLADWRWFPGHLWLVPMVVLELLIRLSLILSAEGSKYLSSSWNNTEPPDGEREEWEEERKKSRTGKALLVLV